MNAPASTRVNIIGDDATIGLTCLSVSFGNPALGTYSGHVYLRHGEKADAERCVSLDDAESLENRGVRSELNSAMDHQNVASSPKPNTIGGDVTTRRTEQTELVNDRIVAMVQVPPDQVPEGVLTFARAHRSYLRHVRIVTTTAATHKKQRQALDDPYEMPLARRTSDQENITDFASDYLMESSTRNALEEAAKIMAHDESKRASAKENHFTTDQLSRPENISRHQSDSLCGRPMMTYLVLFELATATAAKSFVSDLHGQPFTSLEPDVVCQLYPVAFAKGDEGVCIMSPFFASSYETLKASASGGHKDVTVSLAAKSSSYQEKDNCRLEWDATPKNASMGSTSHMPLLSKVPLASPSSNIKTSTQALPSAGRSGGINSISSSTGHYLSGGEIQNCAVCLEPMDVAAEAILTTICNHSFHLDCLLRWQDSPCPVCRYDHSGLNETLSQCHVCGTTQNNYVCLICGVVSCGGGPTPSLSPSTTADDDVPNCNNSGGFDLPGRYTHAGHAREHYRETLHAYALETETQHVWDFAGDGFVHRLIQNTDDGKLVEVNDPSNTSSQQRSLNPGLSDAQEGEIVHRKLEGFASQYYTLLKSQLEQQRIFYEASLSELRREHEEKGVRKSKGRGTTADLISALKQEQNQLEQRCMTLRRKTEKVKEDTTFLMNMNESLEQNKESLRGQTREVERERAETRDVFQKALPPLEEKVRRLMQQIAGSQVPNGERMCDDHHVDCTGHNRKQSPPPKRRL